MATTSEVIKNLEKRIKDIESGKLTEDCFRSAFNALLTRLFDRGMAGDGQRIGFYSTTPIYISQKQAKRNFQGGNIGKTGNTEFADGTPHTSKYFIRGYKQFRADQGLEQSYVNLQVFGDFRRKLTKSFKRETATTWTAGVAEPINQKKASGFVGKYGKRVFEHTPKELETLATCAANATVEVLVT